jgi:endonuclease/exonuclease/phosphatase family metal-dependent hydrolase
MRNRAPNTHILETFWLLLVLVSGCASGPVLNFTAEEVNAYAPFAPPREIRVLSINVWSGLTYEGTFNIGRHRDDAGKRYECLVNEIRNLAPDIIAIQEANPLPAYVERLAKDLDYRAIYRVSLGGIRFGPVGIPTNLREGDAILVKKGWTLVDLGRKCLSGGGIATNWFCFHFGEIRQALLGRAVVNGKLLYIYNVHLRSGPFRGPELDDTEEALSRELTQAKMEEAIRGAAKDIERRRREIVNLKQFIEETLPLGMPAIILGDFNTTVESDELEPLLAGGRWIDTFRFKNPSDPGATWDHVRNPNFRESKGASQPYNLLRAKHECHSCRIDFIFVSSNIPGENVLESRVVLTPSGGCAASDHYGVLTTLKW